MGDGSARPGAFGVPARDVIAQLIAYLWRWRWRLIVVSLAVALLIRVVWTPGKTIVVTFDGADAAERPLLLYSGMRAGTCRAFEPWVGTPSVTLADVKYSASCPTEIDVFARGHGADAYAADPAKPGSETWFTSALSSGGLKWYFPDPETVPLTFWLVADGRDVATAEARRDAVMTWAVENFAAAAAGITLDTVSKPLGASALVAKCANANEIALNASVYDGSRINVYLVETYSADTHSAYSCAETGHKEIVFVAWGGHLELRASALMHELGHALINRPRSGWGHTNGKTGFDSENILWSGSFVKTITVGQLYGIHFSDASWLNHTGPSSVRPLVRTCQDSWGAPPPCPLLSQAQPGWPP